MRGLTRENVASHLQKYRMYQRCRSIEGGGGGKGDGMFEGEDGGQGGSGVLGWQGGQAGGFIEIKHWTGVESSTSPPRVCMSIHPAGKSCSNPDRVLVRDDPPVRGGRSPTRGVR